MSKEPKQCSVCFKKTEDECSHVKCPNRKRVTAQVPDGSTGMYSKDALGRGYAGNFRKFPTKAGNKS